MSQIAQRPWSWLGPSILLAGALAVWIGIRSWHREPERWFMPGPLGHVPGQTPPPPAANAYLTRAMAGVDRSGDGAWARRNALTAPVHFSHNLAGVFPASLYASNPDDFPLVAGRRLRPTDAGSGAWNPDLGNPAVARHAAAAAHLYFEAHRQAESFSLAINDGLIFGESPATLALVTPPQWFRGRPDYSPLVFTFMNRTAQEVAKTDPDKYLGCLAYYWCENAPPFPVAASVLPFLTTDRSQEYNTAFKQQEFELQDRWGRAGPRRLGLYDYLYGGGFLVPRIFTRLAAENIRHAHRAGFTDYYAEVYPNWGLDGPMPWLVAQLLLDPEQSPRVLLDEYYGRYFRSAAGPMRAFFEQCEVQWMHQPGPPYWLKYYRNEAQADLFPSSVCRQLRGLLDEAAAAARNSDVRARVAFVSDAFGLTERFVTWCEARRELVRRELRGELSGEAAACEIRAVIQARSAFVAEWVRLRWQQPLAFYPVGLDDYLRDDPFFGATADALQQTAATSQEKADELAAALASVNDPQVRAAVHAWRAGRRTRFVELTENGSLEGRVDRGKQIAGLRYGLDLPVPWQSKNEPVENEEVCLTRENARHGKTGLQLRGAGDAMLFEWVKAVPGQYDDGGVWVRGQVGTGTIVALTLGWLDANQQSVGKVVVARLPEGKWPDWVRLRQGGVAPAGARWVGIGLRVQHQTAGDWVDVDDFSLRETAASWNANGAVGGK